MASPQPAGKPVSERRDYRKEVTESIIQMLEQGVASARDIDTAMELGYNHPMGPLRLTDLVGLDVRLHIAEYLHGKLGSETFRPPDILRRMVSEGKLGKKSGEGFYKWNEQETGQRAYTT